MGLGSGRLANRAAKRTLCTQHRAAMYRAETIAEGLYELQSDPKTTAIITDGNCAFMGTHQGVLSLDDYKRELLRIMRRDLGTCCLLIINLDDPDYVPAAKGDEQRRRDTRGGAAKTPPSGIPMTDAYGLEMLEGLESCRPIANLRAARYRMMDEVFGFVLGVLTKDIEEAVARGETRKVVVIDGTDPLGASRPHDVPRRPTIVGSDERVAELFARPNNAPIGEGDLKMRVNEEALRRAIDADELDALEKIVAVTVDTDHLAVSFLHHVERLCGDLADGNAVSWIAMNEQGEFAATELATWRGRCGLPPPRQSPYSSNQPSGVLFVEVGKLHNRIMKDLYGAKWRQISPEDRAATARAFVATWALAGCDFVAGIAHFDVLYDSFCRVLGASGATVSGSRDVWRRMADAEPMMGLVRTSVAQCGETPASSSVASSSSGSKSRKRARPVKEDGLDQKIRRSLWTAAYWCADAQGPPQNLAAWGFA